MIATLPMYDFPEVREATDRFWAAIGARLGTKTPLSRLAHHAEAWRRPDLLFSQTCGYPFTHEFRGRLKLVATPHYAADGCEGAQYCSILLAREAKSSHQFKGGVAAFNTRDSMSGMLALQLVFAPLAQGGVFFGGTTETGSHMASLALVQNGDADICAADCVTLAYARRYCPGVLEGLVEIARSPLVPALPYVTVAGDVFALQSALAEVFDDRAMAATREALLLTGVSFLQDSAYDDIVALEAVMEARGGLKLWSV